MYFEYPTIRIGPSMRAELLAHVAQLAEWERPHVD